MPVIWSARGQADIEGLTSAFSTMTPWCLGMSRDQGLRALFGATFEIPNRVSEERCKLVLDTKRRVGNARISLIRALEEIDEMVKVKRDMIWRFA